MVKYCIILWWHHVTRLTRIFGHHFDALNKIIYFSMFIFLACGYLMAREWYQEELGVVYITRQSAKLTS